MVLDYQSGQTCQQVADKFGLKQCTVWEMLKRRGVTRSGATVHRKYACNFEAFDTITSESAYWIGFLITDGCIDGRGGVHLQIQDGDREHLEKFRTFLKSEHPIYTIHPKKYAKSFNSGVACKMSIISKQLSDSLARYGVVQKKSLTMKVVGLENNDDFWRGVIDGNGSIMIKTQSNRPYPLLSLCSGSHEFMEQFYAYLISMSPEYKGTIRRGSHTWYMLVSGKISVFLIRKLYKTPSASLNRKQITAQKILEISRLNPDWLSGDNQPYELNDSD